LRPVDLIADLAGGGAAGAPRAGGNACRVRLRSPRPAFISLSNRSVISKICVIVMFLMPVCFCSSPSFKFYSLVSSGGEFQMFPPARGAPAAPPPARLF